MFFIRPESKGFGAIFLDTKTTLFRHLIPVSSFFSITYGVVVHVEACVAESS